MSSGHHPTCITQNRSKLFLQLTATVVSLAFWVQPAFGSDPSVIAPTRLDFDASVAPQNCNDQGGFRSILEAWVPPTVFSDDAERRLLVRIWPSSTGGKRADVALVDAQGATLAERHTTHATTTECYKVLWIVARKAAELLGAFEPPPPKEPVPTPVPLLCPLCPPARPCPTCPSIVPPRPTVTFLPTAYRSFFGIGGYVGSGIFSELGGGPYMLLGYVPSRSFSDLHIEFEAAWTSQMSPSATTSEAIRVHAIPLVGSLCLVRGIVRFCGGLATTILVPNQSRPNDELHLMLGANFRVGTELFASGPFSVRADVFGRFAFVQRTFGNTTGALDPITPFGAGLAITAERSFD